MNPSHDPALGRRIAPLFGGFTRDASPGCAVGVQRGGELLFSAGYGLACVEHRVPIEADTVFRIASVSKQFTVAAVLRLAARGHLRLDDDVLGLLPELAGLPQRVSVEQLMRNSSGLPDFLELLRLGGVGLDARLDRAAMLQAIARCRHLNFEPGSRFLYCNSNFLLLGVLVERLAGCSLGEFLQREIFAPLQMRSTALVVAADTVVPHLALPYLRDAAGGLRRAMHGFEHGGEGGLVSNVPDLLAWAAELQRPTQLQPDLLAMLSSPTRLSDGANSPYARGLEHSRVRGLDCVGHGGLWPGYRTEFLHVPAEALSVVVISNDAASNPYRLARQVLETVLPPAAAAPTLPAASTLAPYCGRWIHAATPACFDLALVDGEPVITQWGAPFVLQAQPEGRWLPMRNACAFELRPDGADALELDLGVGQRLRFERLQAPVPPAAQLAGTYVCEQLGTRWELVAPADASDDWQVRVQGPLVRAAAPWPLRGLSADLFEVETPGAWMRSAQLARVERDPSGRVVALTVHSSRIRGLRFERTAGNA